MVKIWSESDKKYPRYYKFRIFFTVKIIYWHEKARTGFLKSQNHIFAIT